MGYGVPNCWKKDGIEIDMDWISSELRFIKNRNTIFTYDGGV
jgi:hypothetical protein